MHLFIYFWISSYSLASFSALWLEGVALASDQMTTPPNPIGAGGPPVGGDTFYHGGFIGLEWIPQ